VTFSTPITRALTASERSDEGKNRLWVTSGVVAPLDGVSLAAPILRVRDVAATVTWFRDVLELEPLHVGADGEHPFAAFSVAGAVISLWQLPRGEERRREDNVRNTYVVFQTTRDPQDIRDELTGRGVDVGKLQQSADNEFFWFHDLDGNRFEVARPRRSR
jgi:catechol 2,3-dioxygenase-like lactoylglutathione lyase family enzyme